MNSRKEGRVRQREQKKGVEEDGDGGGGGDDDDDDDKERKERGNYEGIAIARQTCKSLKVKEKKTQFSVWL